MTEFIKMPAVLLGAPIFLFVGVASLQAGTTEAEASVSVSFVEDEKEPSLPSTFSSRTSGASGAQEAVQSGKRTQPAAGAKTSKYARGDRNVTRTLESMSGQVTWIGARSLSLLYVSEGNRKYEMLLPFDQKIRVANYRNLSDIEIGDDVEVEYTKIVESPGTVKERTTLAANMIRLIKRSKQEMSQ